MESALGAAVASGDRAAVLAVLLERTDEVIMTSNARLLARAAEIVADEGGGLPAAVAWRIGCGLHSNGRFNDALATFRRAADLEQAAPSDRAELCAGIASALWGRGEAAAGAEQADLAHRYADQAGLPRPHGSAWIATALMAAHAGDRSACRAAYEQALKYGEAAGGAMLLSRLLTNLGSLENEEGRYDAALVWLERSLDIWGPADGAGRCIAAFNRAESLLALGRLDEAIADLKAAQASARCVQAPLLAVALHGLGEAYRLRGDATRAAAAYREAVATAEQTDQAQVIGNALAGLARTTATEDVESAVALAQRAVNVPAALGQVAALLASGWIGLLAGRPGTARTFGIAAAAEAGKRHNAVGMAEALELQGLACEPVAIDPIREASGLWREAGHRVGMADNRLLLATLTGDRIGADAARRTLQELGVRDDADRILGARHAARLRSVPPVAISALGSFTVLVAGQPVPVSAWGSRKPRDCLKLLAARAGRPVSRDAICEVLWPGQSGTGARLSVVLSTLRSVLDPAKEHGSDRFLVADRTSVRLVLDAVEVDVVGFEAAARAALRDADDNHPDAVTNLQAAAAAYTGDFLDDDRDQPWTEEPREHLAHLARELRRRLALRLGADEPERAVPWLVALLADDEYDEPCHLLLIRSMLRLGRFGEARRAHRAYAAAMAELDLPATPLPDLMRSGQEPA